MSKTKKYKSRGRKKGKWNKTHGINWKDIEKLQRVARDLGPHVKVDPT